MSVCFSGFSYVDKVEGAKDGCYYAVKRILCHDREGRQEAQTEVEMHQLFNHPNILTLVAHTFTDCEGKTEAWLLLPYFRVSLPAVCLDCRSVNIRILIICCVSVNRKEPFGLIWRT